MREAALQSELDGLRNSKGWALLIFVRRIEESLRQKNWRVKQVVQQIFQKLFGPITRLRKKIKTGHEISLIRQSGLFNEDWYLKTNPDVAGANIEPLIHYLYFGALKDAILVRNSAAVFI